MYLSLGLGLPSLAFCCYLCYDEFDRAAPKSNEDAAPRAKLSAKLSANWNP